MQIEPFSYTYPVTLCQVLLCLPCSEPGRFTYWVGALLETLHNSLLCKLCKCLEKHFISMDYYQFMRIPDALAFFTVCILLILGVGKDSPVMTSHTYKYTNGG